MPQVEIFGIERSNYVRMVRMVCEEKGITYDLKPVPPHSPEVLAIHPFGRIPVMRHGDVTLCESKAIATYLDRSFPGPALMPSGARDAALAEQWISLVNTVIDRTLVRTYRETVMVALRFDRIEDFITVDHYAQHASKIGDGISRIAGARLSPPLAGY